MSVSPPIVTVTTRDTLSTTVTHCPCRRHMSWGVKLGFDTACSLQSVYHLSSLGVYLWLTQSIVVHPQKELALQRKTRVNMLLFVGVQ